MLHLLNKSYIDVAGAVAKEGLITHPAKFTGAPFFLSIREHENICWHLSPADFCRAVVTFLREVYPDSPLEEIQKLYDLTIDRFRVQLALLHQHDYSALFGRDFLTMFEECKPQKILKGHRNELGIEYLIANHFVYKGFFGQTEHPFKQTLKERLKKFFDEAKELTIKEIRQELIYKVDKLDYSAVSLLKNFDMSESHIEQLSEIFGKFYAKYAEGYSAKYQELSTLHEFLNATREAEREGYLDFLMKDAKRPYSILFCHHRYVNKVNLYLINYFYDSFLNRTVENRFFFL